VVQLYPRALGSLFFSSYDSQGYGGGIVTHLHPFKSESKLCYDRRLVGEPVLVRGTHLRPATNFIPRFFDYFRQLRIWLCGAPSLTRSRICSFQFLRGIASADFLKSESHGTHENILLSLFLRLLQPGGPISCIYFPQEQGSPVISTGNGFV
jgi:hypothetical protein